MADAKYRVLEILKLVLSIDLWYTLNAVERLSDQFKENLVVDQMPLALRYLLWTSAIVVSSKAAVIMLARFKRFIQKRHYRHVQPILVRLFRNVDAYNISIESRKKEKINSQEYVYGEIVYHSFAEMLSVARPQPNEIFYDLGCGSGKAVFTAAVVYDYLQVRGVEYLKPLYELCLKLLDKYKDIIKEYPDLKRHGNNIEFINADIREYDFSDADIIFINATCFNRFTWPKVVAKFEQLKKGARVIITTKTFESDHFELIHARSYLMSWGSNSIYIYKKI